METLIDLRMEYKRQTGDNETPISHDYFDDPKYIVWLEDYILRLEFTLNLYTKIKQ
jgi:hypothetical protein